MFWKSSRLYLIRLLPTQIAGSFPFNGLGQRQDSGCVPLVSKQPSFVCQLSTLTGPESQGRLGTMSSTSPLAIFSHWPRFSLQIQTTSIRCTVEKISFTSAEAWLWVWNKRIKNHTSTQNFQIMQKLQNYKTHTHTHTKDEVDLQNKTVATTVARQHNQFLLSWRWSLPHVLWLTQECKKPKQSKTFPLLLFYSIRQPDAVYTSLADPTTRSRAPQGLGLLPTRSSVLTYSWGLSITLLTLFAFPTDQGHIL